MGFLRIERVARQFPGVNGGPPTQALERTDLAVEDNDFISILGPSGCGKSTLLRIVAGLGVPSSGRVRLDDEPVARPGPGHGLVVQPHAPARWHTEPGDDPQQRRLAASRRAEDRDEVVVLDGEVGALERLRRRPAVHAGKLACNALDPQKAHG